MEGRTRTTRRQTRLSVTTSKGTITGAKHQWELGHLTETLEWEPPGFVPQDSGMTMGTGKVGSTVNVSMDGQQLFYNRSFPYLADTHWVRLSAKLAGV